MTRFLLKILFYVVIIVLVYNYFLGDSAEKDSSQKIFSEVKTVLVSVKDLLGAEKQKFDQGKYDEALEKIKQGIDKIGSLKPRLRISLFTATQYYFILASMSQKP